MKIVLICSNGITGTDLEKYLPFETNEIVTLGERCLSDSAINHLEARGIVPVDFRYATEKLSRSQAEKRTMNLLGKADIVLAFWDGKSTKTKELIDRCNVMRVPLRVFV